MDKMTDPFSAGGAGFLGGKLVPPLIAFGGAVVSLSYIPELSRRQWAAALLFAVLAAYLIPPIIGGWVRQSDYASWVPADGSIEGLCGLLLGMGSIHLVGAFTLVGQRFARDPWATIKGRKK